MRCTAKEQLVSQSSRPCGRAAKRSATERVASTRKDAARSRGRGRGRGTSSNARPLKTLRLPRSGKKRTSGFPRDDPSETESTGSLYGGAAESPHELHELLGLLQEDEAPSESGDAVLAEALAAAEVLAEKDDLEDLASRFHSPEEIGPLERERAGEARAPATPRRVPWHDVDYIPASEVSSQGQGFSQSGPNAE